MKGGSSTLFKSPFLVKIQVKIGRFQSDSSSCPGFNQHTHPDLNTLNISGNLNQHLRNKTDILSALEKELLSHETHLQFASFDYFLMAFNVNTTATGPLKTCRIMICSQTTWKFPLLCFVQPCGATRGQACTSPECSVLMLTVAAYDLSCDMSQTKLDSLPRAPPPPQTHTHIFQLSVYADNRAGKPIITRKPTPVSSGNEFRVGKTFKVPA